MVYNRIKMKAYVTILNLLIFLGAFAQSEGNIWYFGNHAGVNFNVNPPVKLEDGQINTIEGCSAISDASGQLKFYTDGVSVWNKNHQLMPNGTGLLGHPSSTQSAVIVPKPGSSTIFFLFTVDAQAGPNGFRYSEVDMSLDGGMGDVTSNKNILLFTPAAEKVSAVQNAAGMGFWVVAHGLGSNNFYAYEVTASGININPVISSAGVVIEDMGTKVYGHIKFSPDGTKLVCCNSQAPLQLFDFDTITGAVSNAVSLNTRLFNYGAEFSPSGDKLYVTSATTYQMIMELLQYDLTAANISASEILIYNGAITGDSYDAALQLAPNGKIYASFFGSNFLAVINNPETIATGCYFQKNGINLGSGIANCGLPQFIQSYFNIGITFSDNCFGDSTSFSLSGNQNIISAVWDFGDSTTSSDINANHTYANPGTYSVSVTATSSTHTITRSRQVTVSPVPYISNSIPNQNICGNDTSHLNLAQFTPIIRGPQSSSVFGVEYFSSQSDAENHSNALPVNLPLSFGPTPIFAKIYSLTNKQCNAITSFSVALFEQPVAHLPPDYIICETIPYNAMETFHLQSLNINILSGQDPTNFTITYHKDQADADNGSDDLPVYYTNTNPQEVIFARIENNLNPMCYDSVSFPIKVVTEPNITTVTDFRKCDDASNDGVTTFDLSEKTTEVLGGQSPGVFEVKYYHSAIEANNASGAITSPVSNTSNNQEIFYSVSAIGNSGCKMISSFKLIVDRHPVAYNADDIFICDDGTNDGLGSFNLNANNSKILDSQDGSIFEISYHQSENDANSGSDPLPEPYPNLTNPQIIFARIANNSNPMCFSVTSFQIALHQMPVAGTPKRLFLCDSENDENEIFNLRQQDLDILADQSATGFYISYHASSLEAHADINPLSDQYDSSTSTIFARLENVLSPSCYDIVAFDLNVLANPELSLETDYSICEGIPKEISAPSGFSSYTWSGSQVISTTPIAVIEDAGTYSLTVTKDYGDIICSASSQFTVHNSNVATIQDIEISDWTDSSNKIIIDVTGDGDYEYSVDGIHYQDSNEFNNLENGQYTVYVNDKNRCGIAKKDVYLLMYPKYFTPNGDGINDLWKIKFSSIVEPEIKIFIFDRHGKLITSFPGNHEGWDGTYNGKLLPSTDYWFIVKRQDGKEFKGHFAMKR